MPAEPRKHAHYFKEVPTTEIDVYAVLHAFEVTHPCLQHALKKILVAGKRGSKSFQQDVQEAIDTLERGLEMEMQMASRALRPSDLATRDGWPGGYPRSDEGWGAKG